MTGLGQRKCRITRTVRGPRGGRCHARSEAITGTCVEGVGSGTTADRRRNRRYPEAGSRWWPEKPQPNQTTITRQSSAAIGRASGADGKPTDGRREEEVIGPDEASVGGEKEGDDKEMKARDNVGPLVDSVFSALPVP